MDALIPLAAAVSKATTSGDAAEACKAGGVKLKAKSRRVTYVTDTDNLQPDPGAMSLVFSTKGMMEGWPGDGGGVKLGGCSWMLFPFVSFIEDKLWKKNQCIRGVLYLKFEPPYSKVHILASYDLK